MSEFVFKLPDVGEGVAEAEIVEWKVSVGDAVTEEQPIVDVMTDKATVELPSPVAGTVTAVGAEVGEVLAVGSPLVWIAVDGGELSAPAPAPEPESRPEPEPVPEPEPEAPRSSPKTGVLAAPAVRERARTLGVDLAAVRGSGPDGRVVHADLDAVLVRRGGPRSAARASGEVETVKIIGLRRNIAARMEEAHRIPHFTYVEEVDVTQVEHLRAQLNEDRQDRPKLNVLPFLARAIVLALSDFPQLNGRFRSADGVVERYRAVHLGVAAQTDKGLMVPVVEHAEALDVWELATEIRRLAEAARDGTISLAELNGSTITISSLGALGGVASTPIINAPEIAVIGVNKIVDRPVLAAGTWVPRQTMNLSSSFDHRVVDGYDAAQFIQKVRTLLETPALLFGGG